MTTRHTAVDSAHPVDDETTAVSSKGWRVIDIITAAVLGVAIGLVFWAWNSIGVMWGTAMDGLTPGLSGLAYGPWLLGGIVGGLVIRKPGAAILVEVIAALVSTAIGNQWGIETLYSGIMQGLGAELVFLLFLYRRFTVEVAMLAGVGAGLFGAVNEYILYNREKTATFQVIYAASFAVSGAILAGLVGWLLVKALASTGALDRFGAGREARRIAQQSSAA